MRCFFCDKIEIGEISDSALSKRESEHLFKVLRGRAGERLMLIDGRGGVAEAEITSNRGIRVDTVRRSADPKVRLHLFVAPPRKQIMDGLLKQCSEVGVWSVVPVLTERGVSIPTGDSALVRMKLHLLEGCKQSNNPFLPTISPAISFADALAAASDTCDSLYFGSVDKPDCSTKSTISDSSSNGIDVAWFVGPEGGYSESELDALKTIGAIPLNLGEWILRVETAAIVGAARLISELTLHQHSKGLKARNSNLSAVI